jgi:hypothetical protein
MAILPYFQHVAGLLIAGSLGGIIMNTTLRYFSKF